MKSEMIEKFIADNKELYSESIQDAKLVRMCDYNVEIVANEIHSFTSTGESRAFEYRLDGETYRCETLEQVKLHLESIGYSQCGGSKYNGYKFTNAEKKAEYERAKEQYDHIVECRRVIKDNADKFLFSNFPHTFIRFGLIPESGKSYNFRDNFYEDGVSAYEAVKINGKYYIDIAGSLFTFVSYRDSKTAYEIRGTANGHTGSDGEPLLTSAEIVCEINNEFIGTGADFLADIFDERE